MQRDAHTGLHVAMFAPRRTKCGISDYTRYLAEALVSLPQIGDLRFIPAPENAGAVGTLAALRGYRRAEQQFGDLGARMNGADVAHVQHQYFFFGGVAPHKSHIRAFLDSVRVPLVMTVHEIAQPTEGASFMHRQLLAYANRAGFLHRAVRSFIVHTASDRDYLGTLGVPSERIGVLALPAPNPLPMPDSAASRRKLGLEGRRVVTLFGFLASKKGHFVALDALAEFPDDVVLLFAGDRHPDDRTDYVDRLRSEIAVRGLGERVRITGYVADADIPVLMSATDVAIAPFLQTSGSASLAQLFAYGRAVMASDIPPHREILRAFPGVMETASGAKELAEKVALILTDATKRRALQTAARAYAEQHSYLHMARETAAIYERIRGGA